MRSFAPGDFDYGDSELNAVQERYPDRIRIHELREDGIIVVESTDDSLCIEAVQDAFDLPTTEDSETRTRALAAERIQDSPLVNPQCLPTDDTVSRLTVSQGD